MYDAINLYADQDPLLVDSGFQAPLYPFTFQTNSLSTDLDNVEDLFGLTESTNSLSHRNSFNSVMGFHSSNIPVVSQPSLPFTFSQYIPNENETIAEPLTPVNISTEVSETTVSESSSDSGTIEQSSLVLDVESNDDDWSDTSHISHDYTVSSRSNRLIWTREECKRLRKAVSLFGDKDHWSEVSDYVKTRSVSQCFNKWKNDLSVTRKKRWNADATKRLLVYLKEKRSFHEIEKLMPDFTYIQLYQQYQKNTANHEPWDQWEIETLIALKKEGTWSDTQIGQKLNKRYRDDVKKVWNQIRKNYLM